MVAAYLFIYFFKEQPIQSIIATAPPQKHQIRDIFNLLWDGNHLQDVQTNSGVMIQLLHKATVYHVSDKKNPEREIIEGTAGNCQLHFIIKNTFTPPRLWFLRVLFSN